MAARGPPNPLIRPRIFSPAGGGGLTALWAALFVVGIILLIMVGGEGFLFG